METKKSFSYDEAIELSKQYFNGEELSAKVFVDKYALRDSDGNILEATPDSLHERLAKEFARIDSEKYGFDYEEKYNEYFSAMKNFARVVPQGSPMAAIGNTYQVMSASNCIVIASPEDSVEGIMMSGLELAQLSKRRAGVGVDLSSLRPEGMRVNNAAKTTSGAWSFADFFSYVTRMIAQNGRRAALMITMSVHHPDILKFITMKQDLTKVTGANISVKLTNEFLSAVEKDEEYELRFPVEGTPKMTLKIKAKEVWDTIVNSATKTAEPGMLMWDNIINNLPPNCYPQFKTISTNPSLRGDTLVLTNEGAFPIKFLADNKKYIIVKNIKNEWHEASVFCSGKNKQLFEIKFTNGQKVLCTKEHKWALLNSTNQIWNKFGKVIKKETTSLERGDKIPLLFFENPIDNKNCAFTRSDGFIVGWLMGDGWLSYHKNNKSEQAGFIFSQEDVDSLISEKIINYTNNIAKIPSSIRRDHHTNSFTFCTTDKNVLSKLKFLGAKNKSFGIPQTVFEGNDNFIKGFIDGLFSSDGYVEYKEKLSKCRVILTSKHEKIVNDVQKLLSFYGIKSSIVKKITRNPKFPNGKVYDKEYTRYDLNIDGIFTKKFAKCFNLSNVKKQNKLNNIIENTDDAMYANDRQYLVVKSVTQTEIYEDVYDITVNDDTHTFSMETGVTGNCSEIALSSYDSCRLISINLTGYVKNAFTKNAFFDLEMYKKDVRTAMQMADNLVDLELELIEKIINVCSSDNEKALWKKLWQAGHDGRRTGLGTHGLADTLSQLCIRYDSDEASKVIDLIYKTLRNEAYGRSIELAKERGSFPVYNYELEESCEFIQRLPEELKLKMRMYGRRNIALLTQAPTGSVSIVSKVGEFNSYNVSSGIEPVFRNSYTRRKKINYDDKSSRIDFVDVVGDKWQEFKVFHSNVRNYLNEFNLPEESELPDYFVTSDQINWEKRVELQGIEQQYVDHSISSTINLPKGTPVEVVSKLYLDAWKKGLKGVTVYVDGSRDGVLITEPKKEKVEKGGRPQEIVPVMAPKRPNILPCEIHQASVNGTKYNVIVSLLNDAPYEMFMGHSEQLSLPSKSMKGKVVKVTKGKYNLHVDVNGEDLIIKDIINTFDNKEMAWASRMISTSLRHGIPVDFLVEQLSKDGGIGDINKVISRILKKYIKEGMKVRSGVTCTSCNSAELVYRDGCQICMACGAGKC